MKVRHVLVVFICFAAWQVSCLSMEDPGDEALRTALADYEASSALIVDAFNQAVDNVLALEAAAANDDLELAEQLLADQDRLLAELDPELGRWQEIELFIQGEAGEPDLLATSVVPRRGTLTQAQQPTFLAKIADTLFQSAEYANSSLHAVQEKFAAGCRSWRESRSEPDEIVRTQLQDQARTAIREARNEVGVQLIKSGGSAVITAVVPGATLGKVLVQNAAKAVYERGVDYLGGSSAGASGQGDSLVAARSDSSGRLDSPAGTYRASISGEGYARVQRGGIAVTSGQEVVVRISPPPIREATRDNLNGGSGGGGGGGGTSTSGTWPAETVDGMQLQYTVSGARLSAPVDRPATTGVLSHSRSYTGTLDGSTLRVQGVGIHDMSHPAGTEWGDFGATLDVVVTVNEDTRRFFDQTDPGEGSWSAPFDLSVPVPSGAYFGYFRMVVTFVNPRYGDREVRVTGELSGP